MWVLFSRDLVFCDLVEYLVVLVFVMVMIGWLVFGLLHVVRELFGVVCVIVLWNYLV